MHIYHHTVPMRPLLRVSPGWEQVSLKAVILIQVSGFSSRLTEVGIVHFLLAVWLSSPFSCWPWARNCSCLLKVSCSSLPNGPGGTSPHSKFLSFQQVLSPRSFIVFQRLLRLCATHPEESTFDQLQVNRTVTQPQEWSHHNHRFYPHQRRGL